LSPGFGDWKAAPGTAPFGGKFTIGGGEGTGGFWKGLNPWKGKAPTDMTEFNKLGLGGSDPAGIAGANQYGVSTTGDASIAESLAKKVAPKPSDVIPKTKTGSILESIKKFGLDNKAMLGILGLSAAAGAYTAATDVDEVVEEMDRGVPLKIREIREEVIEAFKDPSGKKLAAIRTKYPFLGAKETKNIGIMAEGGRAGYYAGGQSIPSEYTIEDARKTAMQDRLGGITEVMKQADLYRQGDVGQMYMNQGGRIRAQEGGLMDLGGMEKDYRNEGGFVPIGAKEKADDVPARLSVNEFVMTADAVRGAGGGDIDKGAEIMENVMKNLEKGGRISEESQGLEGAQEMFDVSERLSEVVG